MSHTDAWARTTLGVEGDANCHTTRFHIDCGNIGRGAVDVPKIVVVLLNDGGDILLQTPLYFINIQWSRDCHRTFLSQFYFVSQKFVQTCAA